MDTIFAPATPIGRSGVAVIRISGKMAEQCFASFGMSKTPAPRMAVLTSLRNLSTNHVIDNALVLWFPAPYSFTGENTVELHLHGSRAVVKEILSYLEKIPNFRMAKAGEFTRQALYNNKMNLAEAEGLADLIDSDTIVQKNQALRQMEGHLGRISGELRHKLIAIRANLEAYLDFPDEDLPDDLISSLEEDVLNIQNVIKNLLDDNNQGEKIRDGFLVVILGKPNVGKSTFINALAKRDIAIVSSEAGTTRDVIEAHLDIKGYSVTVADTAGLRDAKSDIELEGIRRAKAKAQESDIKLFIYEADDLPNDDVMCNHNKTQDEVVIINKIDLLPQHMVDKLLNKNVIHISAKNKDGVDIVINRIADMIENRINEDINPVITRARHRSAFIKSLEHLELFFRNSPLEIKAEELRLSSNAIGEIIGAIYLDDVLDKLFSSFCIGK